MPTLERLTGIIILLAGQTRSFQPHRRASLWTPPLASSLFDPPDAEACALYEQAERQMEQLHAGKCDDEEARARDAEFWRELEARTSSSCDTISSLWRFRRFLRVQRIIALPLSGRTRIEGVSRMSLGPLKDMDEGRRQVRALCYYQGLALQPAPPRSNPVRYTPLQPFHDPDDFPWLAALRSQTAVIRQELDAFLLDNHSSSSSTTTTTSDSTGGGSGVGWVGNDCETFDEHGWTQVSLNSYGKEHPEARPFFPRTLALLRGDSGGHGQKKVEGGDSSDGDGGGGGGNGLSTGKGVPLGPRDCCIVRQAPGSGLPRHSDQRNYMLTAHIVLKAPPTPPTPQPQSPPASPLSPTSSASASSASSASASASSSSSSSPSSSVLQRALASRNNPPPPQQQQQQQQQEAAAAAAAAAAARPRQVAGAGGCSLWCDGEERVWAEGASTVIDTTFWHETWNGGTEPVFVLLVDFWHPGLSPREASAMQAFLDLEAEYIQQSQSQNQQLPLGDNDRAAAPSPSLRAAGAAPPGGDFRFRPGVTPDSRSPDLYKG